MSTTGTGVTGIFGLLLCVKQPVQYIIMFIVAFDVAFGLTSAIYKDEDKPKKKVAAPAPKPETGTSATATPSAKAVAATGPEAIVSPMAGEAISMTEIGRAHV